MRERRSCDDEEMGLLIGSGVGSQESNWNVGVVNKLGEIGTIQGRCELTAGSYRIKVVVPFLKYGFPLKSIAFTVHT